MVALPNRQPVFGGVGVPFSLVCLTIHSWLGYTNLLTDPLWTTAEERILPELLIFHLWNCESYTAGKSWYILCIFKNPQQKSFIHKGNKLLDFILPGNSIFKLKCEVLRACMLLVCSHMWVSQGTCSILLLRMPSSVRFDRFKKSVS